LLFLDEIQAHIPAISKLRFFYEKHPDLHVIAAGSLLEFAFEELPSFGVGRIDSMFLYPFYIYKITGCKGERFLSPVKMFLTVGRLPLTVG
jgi:predicted AAA+ superfamily ATPase